MVAFWKRDPPGRIAKPWSPFSSPWHVTRRHLRQAARHTAENLFEQPLDKISEYFGEGVGFYFAFFGFYTKWLVLPWCWESSSSLSR